MFFQMKIEAVEGAVTVSPPRYLERMFSVVAPEAMVRAKKGEDDKPFFPQDELGRYTILIAMLDIGSVDALVGTDAFAQIKEIIEENGYRIVKGTIELVPTRTVVEGKVKSE